MHIFLTFLPFLEECVCCPGQVMQRAYSPVGGARASGGSGSSHLLAIQACYGTCPALLYAADLRSSGILLCKHSLGALMARVVPSVSSLVTVVAQHHLVCCQGNPNNAPDNAYNVLVVCVSVLPTLPALCRAQQRTLGYIITSCLQAGISL